MKKVLHVVLLILFYIALSNGIGGFMIAIFFPPSRGSEESGVIPWVIAISGLLIATVIYLVDRRFCKRPWAVSSTK
jgi:hypothetical protein